MSLSISAARAQLIALRSNLSTVNHECVFANGYELEHAQEVRSSLWAQEAVLLSVIGNDDYSVEFIDTIEYL